MSVFGDVTFKKGTIYKLNPADIQLPDSTLQGRMNAPKNVKALAEDIKTNGQISPVLIRKNAENQPILVAGFRRLAAFQEVNKERQKNGEEPFLIDALVQNIDEETAFMLNVAENRERQELSPMDMLKISVTLQKRFGKSIAEVAKVLGRGEWIVHHLNKLASMSPRVQKLCDQGIMSLNTVAMHLVRVPEEARDEIIDQILAEQKSIEETMIADAQESGEVVIDDAAGKKITANAIAQAERKRREKKSKTEMESEAENGNGNGNGEIAGEIRADAAVRHTLASTKKFLASVVGNERRDVNVRAICEIMLTLMEGGLTERAFTTRLNSLLKRVRENQDAEIETEAAAS